MYVSVCLWSRFAALSQLHKDDYKRKQYEYQLLVQERLRQLTARGVAALVIQHLVARYRDKLQREHDWLSVAKPTMDSQVGTETSMHPVLYYTSSSPTRSHFSIHYWPSLPFFPCSLQSPC